MNSKTLNIRSLRLWISLLAALLAFNSTLLMGAQTHMSFVDETTMVEGLHNEPMVENCGGIHCNFVVDATTDVLPFLFNLTLDPGLPSSVADFIYSPLEKPPRPFTV